MNVGIMPTGVNPKTKRKSKCLRKRPYKTLGLAFKAINNIPPERGKGLVAYNCRFCRGYHLGNWSWRLHADTMHRLGYWGA